MKLPFKENTLTIEDNYEVAKPRLKGLTKRFKNDRSLLKKYNDIINDQFQSKIIEHASVQHETGGTHYLPHRPIIRENKKTTKTRMVFDASSKSKYSKSLNKCLFAGPSLTPSLYGVLTRFRAFNYALVADIEKAFLQIPSFSQKFFTIPLV